MILFSTPFESLHLIVVISQQSQPSEFLYLIAEHSKVCVLVLIFSSSLKVVWVLLRRGSGTPSSALAWKIPWTEEPGGLQSTGSRRVGHD